MGHRDRTSSGTPVPPDGMVDRTGSGLASVVLDEGAPAPALTPSPEVTPVSFPTPPPEGDDNPFSPPPADGSGAVPPPPVPPTAPPVPPAAPAPDAATPPPAYGSPAPPPPPPAYGAPGYGAPPVPAGYGYTAPQNGSGTAALILGIVGLICCGLFTGIPAIILGRKGMALADAGQANNRGVAQAGYILGIIVTVLSVIGIIAWVFLLATGKATTSTTISP